MVSLFQEIQNPGRSAQSILIFLGLAAPLPVRISAPCASWHCTLSDTMPSRSSPTSRASGGARARLASGSTMMHRTRSLRWWEGRVTEVTGVTGVVLGGQVFRDGGELERGSHLRVSHCSLMFCHSLLYDIRQGDGCMCTAALQREPQPGPQRQHLPEGVKKEKGLSENYRLLGRRIRLPLMVRETTIDHVS